MILVKVTRRRKTAKIDDNGNEASAYDQLFKGHLENVRTKHDEVIEQIEHDSRHANHVHLSPMLTRKLNNN